MAETSSTIAELIRADHEKVARLLAELDSTADSRLEDYFTNLREELVRHEVAEEVVLYPALRKDAANGDVVADSCIAEQASAEETLKTMEKVQKDPAALRAELEQLRKSVIEHKTHEETAVLPLIEASLSREQLVALGQKYEKAISAAPTRPHPHAPDSPPGNKILGPVAGLFDRMRDAMGAA